MPRNGECNFAPHYDPYDGNPIDNPLTNPMVGNSVWHPPSRNAMFGIFSIVLGFSPPFPLTWKSFTCPKLLKICIFVVFAAPSRMLAVRDSIVGILYFI